MGTTKAAGSEVANVKRVQPAGGRADSRHLNTEARIMYCLGTAVTSDDITQMLKNAVVCPDETRPLIAGSHGWNSRH